MSLDLSSDPAIEQAYQTLLFPPSNPGQGLEEDAVHDFMLLEYDHSNINNVNASSNGSVRSSFSSQQALRLAKLGSNGIDQLRPLFKPGEVLFALIRIQRKILIIQYFSEAISGVKRARALVHGRAVCGYFKAASANVVIARQEDLTEHLIRSSLKLDKSLPITSEAEKERQRQERLSVAWPTSSSRGSLNGGSPDTNGTPKARSERFDVGSSPTAAAATASEQSSSKNSPALRDFDPQNSSPASGNGGSPLKTSSAGYSSSRPKIQGLGLGLDLTSSSNFSNGTQDKNQSLQENVEINGTKAASSRNGCGETTKSSPEISRWSLTTSSSPGAEEDVTASIMRRNEALNVVPTGLTAAGTSNVSLAPSSAKEVATPLPLSANPTLKSPVPKTPKTPKSSQSARSRTNSSTAPPGPPPIGVPLPPLPGDTPMPRSSPMTPGPPALPLPPLPTQAQGQPHPNKAIPPPPPADEEEAARLEKEKEEFLAFQRNEALRSEAVDRERQRRKELELIKRDEAKRAEVMKRLAEEQEKEIGRRSAKGSPSLSKTVSREDRERTKSGSLAPPSDHPKGLSETDTTRTRTLSHQTRGERGAASESISRIASPSHTLSPPKASSPPATRSRRQQEDDEGETWLSRHTRKQSEERVLGGMYSKVQVDKDLPSAPRLAPKSPNGRKRVESGERYVSGSEERLAEQAAAHAAEARRRAEQIALAQIERARAEQRSLEFQLSEVERRNRERNEAEAAARARWVRQQAERERLDAFERSKLESAERLRREAVEKRNREEAHSAEETRKEKAKKAQEEKEAIEQAQRRRKDAEEREQRLKMEVARRKEREEEVRLREEKKRLQRQSLMNKFENRSFDSTVVLSGNVTVQKSDATIWRRRFYELRGSDLSLSKSELEKSTVLDTIQLRGQVRSLEDDPEDSQMLNSFSLGFNRPGSEETETLLLATDTHEEKELLLCAIGVLSKSQS